ncbi:MAG: peptidylprolyl isomerase [Bacteroidota bacterium]|nr:peptidylprolyl isomerase [Bacteroidota bacterium]
MSLLRNSFLTLFVVSGLLTLFSCGEETERKALISTDYGDITIMLYNSTPKHRDNFIKLVKEGYFDGLLFHRVIDSFMIQGGDPNSKNATPGALLGEGNPGYEIDAEIGAPHLRGAIGAARTPNPGKKSNGSQFYIVTGTSQNENELEYYERSKKITYSESQRKIYDEEGGYPSLDMEYTVFGEVVSGMEIVDKIDALEKDNHDRPVKDVRMKIKMIN